MSTNKTPSIKEIKDIALNNIGSILDRLGIEWAQRSEDYINIICPVHKSEDLGSSSIRLDNGIYQCWSRGCHEVVGNNFLDLIRWCLSFKDDKNPAHWGDVCKFVQDQNFIKTERPAQEKVLPEIKLMDVSKYPSVTIPSKYYIDRGILPETLIHFGIGDTLQFPYCGRSIVPIKTKDGALMGFSGRSEYSQCPKCEFYHSKYQTCIAKDYEYASLFNKWFHSKGLQKSRTLYGIEFIPKKTKKIAIVEGPSCVWKLYEKGIPAVAALGKSFGKPQVSLLNELGVSKVFLLSDQDEAGKIFRQKFIEDFYSVFQIYITELPEKDVTDMSDNQINEFIVKKWNNI